MSASVATDKLSSEAHFALEFLDKFKSIEQEASLTVILPPMVSVLWSQGIEDPFKATRAGEGIVPKIIMIIP